MKVFFKKRQLFSFFTFFLLTLSVAQSKTIRKVDFENYRLGRDGVMSCYNYDNVIDDFGGGWGGVQYGAWGIFESVPSLSWTRELASGYQGELTLGGCNGRLVEEEKVRQSLRDPQTDSARGTSLMVEYQKDMVCKDKHGLSFTSFVRAPRNELFMSYDVMFAIDHQKNQEFDFAVSGKLMGLCGGKCNSGGQTPDGADGWSTRLIWIKDGQLALYVYHKDQKGKFGDVYYACYGRESSEHFAQVRSVPCANSEDRVLLTPGKFHSIQIRTNVNDYGQDNGSVDVWANGQKVISTHGFTFKAVDNDQLNIKGFMADTCFGGSTDDFKSHQDNYAFFDNFTLSEQFIDVAESIPSVEITGLAYPNPTIDVVNIPFKLNRDVESIEVNVYDTTGRGLIKADDLPNWEGEHVYNFSLAQWGDRLPPGVYLVSLQVEGKVIKTHKVLLRGN